MVVEKLCFSTAYLSKGFKGSLFQFVNHNMCIMYVHTVKQSAQSHKQKFLDASGWRK